MSELDEVVDAAIIAARRYTKLTGKPLGITYQSLTENSEAALLYAF